MLSEQEYRQLTFLARLDPDDEALLETHKEFKTILSYIDKIKEIDTSSITNEVQKTKPKTIVSRADIQQNTELELKQIIALAPDWQAGYFVIPEVIESEEH